MKNSCSDIEQKKKDFFPLFTWIKQTWIDKDSNFLFEKLLKKQNFPYSYLKTPEILEEKRLPDKDFWIDTFQKKQVSQDDIDEANEIFDIFKCQNIGDYLNIYLCK